MTDDLLTAQAAIKSRKLVRDTSGQFRRQEVALAMRLAAERMKARLLKDVRTAEHARGVVYERGHYHALPHTAKPLEGDGEGGVVDLFDRRQAA